MNIRKYRENNHLTQQNVALEIGCTSAAISNWENGKREPSIKMLKRLAEIFHCTVDELLKGED